MEETVSFKRGANRFAHAFEEEAEEAGEERSFVLLFFSVLVVVVVVLPGTISAVAITATTGACTSFCVLHPTHSTIDSVLQNSNRIGIYDFLPSGLY